MNYPASHLFGAVTALAIAGQPAATVPASHLFGSVASFAGTMATPVTVPASHLFGCYGPELAQSSITVSPSTATLASLATQQFTASGSATSADVTWTCSGGYISPTGLYQALCPGGSYTVTATSVAYPGVSGSAGVTVGEATDLINAVVAWLYGQCGSLINWGWIGTGIAPPNTDLPWVGLTEVSEKREDATGQGDYIDDGVIQVTVFGTGKDATRSLAKQFANALNDAPLVYTGGRLMKIRQSARPIVMQDPIDFAQGRNIWQESRSFAYRTQGNYSGAE